jgi:outer membrane protein TolC
MDELFKSSCGRIHRGWWLTPILLLAVTGAWAGSPAPASNYHRDSVAPSNPPPWRLEGPLTEELALQRALACDSRIASLKAAVEVARQERLAATDIKDPVVQGESRAIGRSISGANDEIDDARVSLGVYLPNPWMTLPRVDARTADYEAARADLRAAVWSVTCEVRRLFAQLDYLTNDLAFSADEVRLNGEVLDAMQARLKQGATTASEMMTASRQFLQFQNEFDQTTHRYQLARQQLAAALDISPLAFELATNTAPPPLLEPTMGFPDLEGMADRSRYDLAALRWRAQAAESDYHEIRNQRWPWLKELKAGYLDKSDQYWVGAAMDIPIFTWTKNHAADVVRAKSDLARVEVTNAVKLVRQELHAALDEVDQTRHQQARNDANVKPLIATMQQALTSLKNTPNVMPEQLAAAELQVVETMRFDLDTHWQYQLALYNLEQSLGVPLSPEPPATPAR